MTAGRHAALRRDLVRGLVLAAACACLLAAPATVIADALIGPKPSSPPPTQSPSPTLSPSPSATTASDVSGDGGGKTIALAAAGVVVVVVALGAFAGLRRLARPGDEAPGGPTDGEAGG